LEKTNEKDLPNLMEIQDQMPITLRWYKQKRTSIDFLKLTDSKMINVALSPQVQACMKLSILLQVKRNQF